MKQLRDANWYKSIQVAGSNTHTHTPFRCLLNTLLNNVCSLLLIWMWKRPAIFYCYGLVPDGVERVQLVQPDERSCICVCL